MPGRAARSGWLKTRVLIVGGGIAGLTAAWRLEQAGIEYRLIEARQRLGGRIQSVEGHGALDLGPSWIWPGQPLVAGLLAEFGLAHFSQQSAVDMLHQDQTGRVRRYRSVSPMANAYRIGGGTSALTDAIAKALPEEKINLGHRCRSLRLDGADVCVGLTTPDGDAEWNAETVALALPPRLAANLDFAPALSAALLDGLRDLPTWMAAHAKIVAVYDRPFWRDRGLSGTAMSAKGPMVEIHDASAEDGGPYALFGFVGYPAEARREIGEEALLGLAREQLVAMFGEEAGSPLEVVLQDWSTDPWTAGERDREPLRGHPRYGLDAMPDSPWAGRLHFISTETAHENGGLIEGAIARGTAFARAYVDGDITGSPDAGSGREANMDWDWLSRK